jgi:hypothetical protein
MPERMTSPRSPPAAGRAWYENLLPIPIYFIKNRSRVCFLLLSVKTFGCHPKWACRQFAASVPLVPFCHSSCQGRNSTA